MPSRPAGFEEAGCHVGEAYAARNRAAQSNAPRELNPATNCMPWGVHLVSGSLVFGDRESSALS